MTQRQSLYGDKIIAGTMSSNFYLTSDHYASDQLLNKIDSATSLLAESGLHKFYTSFIEFKGELNSRDPSRQQVDNDEIQALTMEQLKKVNDSDFLPLGAYRGSVHCREHGFHVEKSAKYSTKHFVTDNERDLWCLQEKVQITFRLFYLEMENF